MAAVVTLILAYARYAGVWGKRTSSPALLAESRHRRIDLLSASLALLAVVSTYVGVNVDRLAALPVLGLAAYSGRGLLVDGMRVLLDESVDTATLERMKQVLSSHPLVEEIDALAARSAGRYLFVEATLRLRTRDLTRAHAVTQRLEAEMKHALPSVNRVVLHLEPRRRDVLRAAVPLASRDCVISAEFGDAPFFALVDMRSNDSEVLRRDVLENTLRRTEKQKGIVVAEWLVPQGIDVLLTARNVNKGPSYVVRGAGVEVRRVRPLAAWSRR
jgi:predicted Fe-Mo cluster-binding NifX family protein